ncbi:MAG: hypothetical protein ABJG88_06530 [Litorimonas sp.]
MRRPVESDMGTHFNGARGKDIFYKIKSRIFQTFRRDLTSFVTPSQNICISLRFSPKTDKARRNEIKRRLGSIMRAVMANVLAISTSFMDTEGVFTQFFFKNAKVIHGGNS